MARALSSLFSIIRGSVAGTTFTANQYHSIIARQRVSPVQPQSQARTVVRSAFAAAVAAWELLTDQERAAWDAYAETVVRSGPLGNYSPSGRDLAIGQYSATAYCNVIGETDPQLVYSMDAPAEAGALAYGYISLSAPDAGTGIKVSVLNNNGVSVLLYGIRSIQVSNARNYWTGPFLPGTYQDNVAADEAVGAIEFTGLVEGGVYFAKVNLLSSGTGRRMARSRIVRFVAESAGV